MPPHSPFGLGDTVGDIFFGWRAALQSAAGNGIAASGYGCYSANMSLKLDIPDDVAHALRLPPAEAESEMLKEIGAGVVRARLRQGPCACRTFHLGFR